MSFWGATGRCALLVAHPGHELHVFGWLEAARPTVCVLTDGSGRSGRSRLASTSRLLAGVGARAGAIYGRYPDRAIYDAVLAGNSGLFQQLAAELADELVRERIQVVVGDAAEGKVLAHDVWRTLIEASIAAAEQRLGRAIVNCEFALEGPPQLSAASAMFWHRLDDAALGRKLAAARAYGELQREVQKLLDQYGEDAFRVESFAAPRQSPFPHVPPEYERHGEALTAAGVYPTAVRYQEHVRPLIAALEAPRRAA